MGQIGGAYFKVQETLNGYYHVFHEILHTLTGFLTDKRIRL